MTKPRLLALVQLPPPIHGVSRANQVLLEDPQLRAQFEVHTINLSFGGAKASRGQASLGRVLYGLKVMTRLIGELRSTDLVYFTPALQGHALWRDTMIASLIRHYDVPYILHPHSGGIGTDDHDRPFSPRLRAAVKKMFHRAQRVLLLHESIREGYDEFIRKDQPVSFVGNGVPQATVYPCLEIGSPLRLAFIGNLIRYKGFHHAIDVIRELPQATLDVVGDFSDSNYKDEIQQRIAKNELGDRIIFHGRQEPESAWSAFTRCHFLIFTSDWKEGLPLVWLESMMRGLPVASFKIGAWRLLTETPNAILTQIGDSKALARRLADLVDQPETYKQLRQNVAAQAQENYSAKDWVKRIIEALNQVR